MYSGPEMDLWIEYLFLYIAEDSPDAAPKMVDSLEAKQRRISA